MEQKYSILVNTTDSFEDCWIPFFQLFKKYWPDYKGNIYLNTENKDFTYPGLKIIPVKNIHLAPVNNKSWSACLKKALEFIDESIILYLQEDYFIKNYVDHNKIVDLVNLISTDKIDVIHLTDQATPGPFHESIYEELIKIDQGAPYRISTQAAIWKKDVLLGYLRKNESPWEFEIYGTLRSHVTFHQFFNVNTSVYKLGIKEIIPYIFTGIIRGKWLNETLDLFNNEGILIDFDKRGVYDSIKDRPNRKKYLTASFYQNRIRAEFEYFILKHRNKH